MLLLNQFTSNSEALYGYCCEYHCAWSWHHLVSDGRQDQKGVGMYGYPCVFVKKKQGHGFAEFIFDVYIVQMVKSHNYMYACLLTYLLTYFLHF